MRCCGAIQEITVVTPLGEVVLVRCAGCGDQRWCADGRELERDTAFSVLASAYRAIPAQAAASRERAAAATAARAVRRADAAVGTATPPPVLPETGTPEEPARERLVSLLEGWQVLGTPA